MTSVISFFVVMLSASMIAGIPVPEADNSTKDKRALSYSVYSPAAPIYSHAPVVAHAPVAPAATSYAQFTLGSSPVAVAHAPVYAPAPIYHAPASVYHAPAPVYHAPASVYHAPASVYHAHAPYYSSPYLYSH